jgi:hypothetical protein
MHLAYKLPCFDAAFTGLMLESQYYAIHVLDQRLCAEYRQSR